MSVYVVAEFPMTEQGAKDIIEWSKSDDGYVVTREHAGFESIQTLLAEEKNSLFIRKVGVQRRSSSLS